MPFILVNDVERGGDLHLIAVDTILDVVPQQYFESESNISKKPFGGSRAAIGAAILRRVNYTVQTVQTVVEIAVLLQEVEGKS